MQALGKSTSQIYSTRISMHVCVADMEVLLVSGTVFSEREVWGASSVSRASIAGEVTVHSRKYSSASIHSIYKGRVTVNVRKEL